jgi:tRNA U34 2-thiouridine synthase MnmA/TrmU
MLEPVNGVVRGYVLMSGGLDSRLAVCVLREQGIQVTGISFVSPFFGAEKAKDASIKLGVPLVIEEFTPAILGLLEHPPHGFGSQLNPCIDCHTAMIKLAGQRAERDGFQFVATGEVLNQRPMSQTKRSLAIVAKDSCFAEWLIRPLSAQLLEETEPERRGWVDRSRLLDLSGRSRKPQVALAKKYGLTDYPAAGGGCCLTEPNYAVRLRDLRSHGMIKDLHAIALLKFGRHFRLSEHVKVAVGRDVADNAMLESLASHDDVVIETISIPGPVAMVTGPANEKDVMLAASLCVWHSDQKTGEVEVLIKSKMGKRPVMVSCATAEMVSRFRVK